MLCALETQQPVTQYDGGNAIFLVLSSIIDRIETLWCLRWLPSRAPSTHPSAFLETWDGVSLPQLLWWQWRWWGQVLMEGKGLVPAGSWAGMCVFTSSSGNELSWWQSTSYEVLIFPHISPKLLLSCSVLSHAILGKRSYFIIKMQMSFPSCFHQRRRKITYINTMKPYFDLKLVEIGPWIR